MFNLKSILVYSLLFAFFTTTAQNRVSPEFSINSQSDDAVQRCHTDEIHAQRMTSDVDYRNQFESNMARSIAVSSANPNARIDCSDPIIIPVAVHFKGVTSQTTQCLIDLALSQIDVLNEDFSSSNTDVVNFCDDAENSDLDPEAIAANGACVQFCLADQNHPAGQGLIDGDYAVTINQGYNSNAPVWSGYMNIFVEEGTGVLGFSPLFGSANGDGITIEACVMGRQGSGCGNGIGPGAGCGGYNIYNLGRTATHEVGHYLGLPHIWGGNGCFADDGFADTPSQTGSNFGCPAQGLTSCGTPDQYMNYMDYVNDACMYMFSEEQAVRMRNHASTIWTTTSDKCSTTPSYPASLIPFGCNPGAVIADFDVSATSGCEGTIISITNNSIGSISSYDWVFGNGNTSTDENPSDQAYPTAGNFTITLTVTDGVDVDMESVDIIIGAGGVVNHLNGGTLINELAANEGGTSGYVGGHNSFGDEAKAEYFEEGVAGAVLDYVDFTFAVATGGSGLRCVIWDGAGGFPGSELASTTIPILSILTNGLATRVEFGDITLNGPFFAGVDLDYTDGTDVSLFTNENGDTDPTTAWEQWSDFSWHSFNDGTTATWQWDAALAVEAAILCNVDAPPVADFSGSPTTICQGEDVQFTDESSNLPHTWLWDFGDGVLSTDQNPTHTYNTAGNFTVSLTATNDDGLDTETKTDYITVQAAPTGFAANATPGTICAGAGTELTMSGTFGGSYFWTEDENIIANSSFTTVSPETTTTYVAICDDGVCRAEDEVTVTVNPLPDQPTIAQTGPTLTASSGSSGNWQWFLNGTPIGGANTDTHVALADGDYTVSITDGNGCVNTSEALSVSLSPPVAAFSADVTQVCQGDEVNFTDASTNSPTNWLWDFGDGNSSTDQNPTHTYGVNGFFTVSLTVTNDFGMNTETKPNYITVQAMPTGFSAAASSTEICEGESVSVDMSGTFGGAYSWEVEGQVVSNSPSATFTPTVTTLYVAVCDNGVCRVEDEITITVNPAPETPVIVQNGAVLNASSSSSGDWQWNLNGNAIGGATNSSYTIIGDGSYTVTLTSNEGCSSTSAAIVITGAAPPEADFTANEVSICEGESISFSDNSSNSPSAWSWDFGDGNTSTDQNPNHVYATSGSYTVTLTATNDFGMDTEIKTNHITVNAVPATPTISQAANVLTASSTSSGNWQWYLDGNAIAGATDASYTATADGDYTVVLTSAEGCASATSNTETVLTSGIIDQYLNAVINLYPNPAADRLQIEFSAGITDQMTMTITDVAGKELYDAVLTPASQEFDLRTFSPGVYVFSFMTEDGRFVSKRIVKQ